MIPCARKLLKCHGDELTRRNPVAKSKPARELTDMNLAKMKLWVEKEREELDSFRFKGLLSY